MVGHPRTSTIAQSHLCRLCREQLAQRRFACAGMCQRCHKMTQRQKLCIRCCRQSQRRPVGKYSNMCLRCFRACDIIFECRRCMGQFRRQSSQIPVPKVPDAEDLCLDCYQLAKAEHVCLRCFQNPRDRRRGSRSLCVDCQRSSSCSADASLSSGANCRKCDAKLASWMKPILDGLRRTCDVQLQEEQKPACSTHASQA